MTRQTFPIAVFGCALLLAAALVAQDNSPTPSESMDLRGIPAPRGIYYHAASGWAVLSSTVLMPFDAGKPLALEILNVGWRHAIAELPGSHSLIQIGNDARPTFYLHGMSPVSMYLVRARPKADYRELRMPIGGNFREWAHFRSEDVTDVAIQGVNGDVVAIQPAADLKPGEYALALGVQPGDQWIRLGFDFGILGSVPRQ